MKKWTRHSFILHVQNAGHGYKLARARRGRICTRQSCSRSLEILFSGGGVPNPSPADRTKMYHFFKKKDPREHDGIGCESEIPSQNSSTAR